MFILFSRSEAKLVLGVLLYSVGQVFLAQIRKTILYIMTETERIKSRVYLYNRSTKIVLEFFCYINNEDKFQDEFFLEYNMNESTRISRGCFVSEFMRVCLQEKDRDGVE